MVGKEPLCLCEMCKCGRHRCPQQDAKELPKIREEDFEMSHDVIRNKYQRIHDTLRESNMYTRSTYREDFQVKTKTPCSPEPLKLASTQNCEIGKMQTDTTYSWDFVPWSVEDMKLCRSALTQDHAGSQENGQVEMEEQLDVAKFKPEVAQRLYEYYCPAHCLGNVKKPTDKNSLVAYKDKFNLGPPQKKKTTSIKKSSRPISKFTNYLLDYIPHQIEPRQNLTRKQDPDDITRPSPPQTLDTTHKTDYTCWSPDNYMTKKVIHKESIDEGKSPKSCAQGPMMVTQSIQAMDYKNPNVTGPSLVRPPRGNFRLPFCRMETETTTGTSFPKWTDLPPKLASTLSRQTRHKPPSDNQCFVTMYQQDFDNLREVFCPAKIIEKHGRKVLEPKCSFVGVENEHEYYRFEKK